MTMRCLQGMSSRMVVLLVLLAASFIRTVSCQTTQNHWVRRHVGDVSSAVLSSDGKSFLVSSFQGAVGAVDARNGSLLWRDNFSSSTFHILCI